LAQERLGTNPAGTLARSEAKAAVEHNWAAWLAAAGLREI